MGLEDDTPFALTRNSEGEDVEIYGLIDPDTLEMYLDEDIIKPEHPIHEYTHIWDRATYQKNKDLWDRGVILMKDTDLWNEILNDPNYGPFPQSLFLLLTH